MVYLYFRQNRNQESDFHCALAYEWDGAAATLSNMKNPMKGCGPFEHDDPTDRPPEIFGGKVTLHFGPAAQAAVLLPIIP